MKRHVFVGLISFCCVVLFFNIALAEEKLSVSPSITVPLIGNLLNNADCDPLPLHIMPLGDSITYGSGMEGGYRISLWNSLLDNDLPINFVGSEANGPATIDRDHEGHPGKAIRYFQENIDRWLKDQHPQVILLMVGTNNILYPQFHDFAGAPDQLSELIDEITKNSPETELFVASVPVLREPDANQRARLFDLEIASIVDTYMQQSKRVHYVDMYGALTPEDLADGVHPDATGYEKVANVWYNALVELIEPKTVESVDRSAPKVTLSLPDSYRFSHQFRAPIVLIFDQAVDASTITPQTVMVNAYPNGQARKVSGTPRLLDSNKLIFCPNHHYPVGMGNTTVTITLSGDDTGHGVVKSELGIPLDGNADGVAGGNYVAEFHMRK